MTSRAYDEAAWIRDLIREAERDLVFVFNIAAGAFGGPTPAPTPDQLPDFLERIAAALLEAGCRVGFGDPRTGTWEEAERLRVPAGRMPAAIASYYAEAPDEAKFLTLTLRKRAGHLHVRPHD